MLIPPSACDHVMFPGTGHTREQAQAIEQPCCVAARGCAEKVVLAHMMNLQCDYAVNSTCSGLHVASCQQLGGI